MDIRPLACRIQTDQAVGLLMDSNIAHQFEVEVTKREVRKCDDIQHMREITLSVLDLMEGQRQFFIDHLKGDWI